MKVLVLGSGGREHALAHTFWRQGHTVFAAPGNPGIFQIAKPLSFSSFEKLSQEVQDQNIDLTVVGPETYLEQGIEDFFSARNLPLFGPSQKAARLESSKAFAKAFMAKHAIPTARFQICQTEAAALIAAEKFLRESDGAVIKPSGLTGGKGVVCCKAFAEAKLAIQEMRKFGFAGLEIVVEELLSGPEISQLVFSDGETMIPLLPAQDHKRLLDSDLGPNTGGMGAYAPLPFVDAPLQKIIQKEVIDPTLEGLKKEGIFYRGILYFGLMLTQEGPKVLEYNCRFGDPEAEALLPLLETDLAVAMLLAVQNRGARPFRWLPQSSCTVVLSTKSYPNPNLDPFPIESIQSKDLLVFHAGTSLKDKQLYATGGRIFCVTGLGANTDDAINKTYEAIQKLPIPWAHYRKDIGKQSAIAIKS